MEYNKTKYLKLFQYKNRLKKEGKSLSKENFEEYLNLLTYEVLILDHLRWEQRNRYFSLMKNFIDKKIDVDEYISQLFELKDETQKVTEELEADFEKLKDFEPNPFSKRFSKFPAELSSDCEVFEPDSVLREDFEISKEELRNCVKKTFSEIQKSNNILETTPDREEESDEEDLGLNT